MRDVGPAVTTYHRDVLPEVPADPLSLVPVCAACPKLCAPSCPVQFATGREAAAPWRIAATVRDAARDGWAPAALHTAASCSGCGACSHACAPGVRLPEMSRAARATAAGESTTLPAADAMAARIATSGSPRPPDRWAAELAAGSTTTAATALFFGCTVQTHSPAIGRSAVALLAAAGEVVRCAPEEKCCGAAAVDLGLSAEAAVLATSCAAQLDGAQRVVVVSPGCARMMRDEWPRLGVSGPDVVTAVEWLDLALADGALPAPPQSGGAVTWHAPCTLVRLLGVVDPPLRVLGALGYDVREPLASGVHTRCAGGGQGYPLVDADGSRAVAMVRANELTTLAAPVVSACPQAERMLTSAGAPTRDILEVAAERLLGRSTT